MTATKERRSSAGLPSAVEDGRSDARHGESAFWADQKVDVGSAQNDSAGCRSVVIYVIHV
jgi:hypothetical protein